MDKYYTPELEDLFIGYECEWFGELGRKLVKSNKEWQKFKIISSNNISPTVLKNLRTQYLIKEHIEAEGWVFNYLGKDDWFKRSILILPYNEIDYPFELWFKLDNYWLGFYKNIHKIVILEKGEDYPGNQTIRFNGYVKSINEFRKIIKLLEI